MIEELKPCPFCYSEVDGHDIRLSKKFGRYWVRCGGCGCGGPLASTELLAIDEWNLRTPEPNTSVLRWTRYDGTVETLPEDNEKRVMVIPFEQPDEIRMSISFPIVLCKGDIWAYLPTPEGM